VAGLVFKTSGMARERRPGGSIPLLYRPGSPAVSMTAATCTRDRMPQDDPGYYDRFPAELATVRTWIQTGAPNN